MLKIRLSRTGKKSQPSYRVVVQEKARAVKGKFIESLGFYRPAEDPKVFQVDIERVKHWISVGAHPSDTMAGLLKRHENLEGMEKFIEPRNKKAKKKKAQPEEEAPAAPAAPAAEAPAAEAPKEEPKAEEPPAEEPKAEEPAAEEPAAPEAPAEEAPVEEKSE